ncbi:MAG: hypothetical protein ACREQI_01095 [Candidatus Binataceae bacterium]
MSNPFLGSWRIVEMELWERADIDLMGRGYIRFDRNGTGEFRFIAVQGGMDCRFAERDGRPIVEFSWNGYDEMDPACGRGWAKLDTDGKLRGRLFFHLGDDSAFTATRERAVRK